LTAHALRRDSCRGDDLEVETADELRYPVENQACQRHEDQRGDRVDERECDREPDAETSLLRRDYRRKKHKRNRKDQTEDEIEHGKKLAGLPRRNARHTSGHGSSPSLSD
jgi:hypothetical protein